MDFTDSTTRQHFISQVEQRLNATSFNSDKIYRFFVIDRKTGRLAPAKSVKIESNLMLHDLFSFDRVPGGKLRANFESLFQEYERDIRRNTHALLEKVKRRDHNRETEVRELLRSKLLNFFRNPFSVKKVLDSLPDFMTDLYPTDPRANDEYARVLNGNKPQMLHVCRALGISEEQYRRWLSSLFFMLNPMIPGQPNFYDQMLKGLCGNRETLFGVHLFTYSDKTCLLSDTGITTLDEGNTHEAWSFNLASNAFVTYSFSNIERFYDLQPDPKPPIPAIGMESIKDITKDHIDIRHYHDSLEVLSAHNQRVIQQCHQNVYSASKRLYGVNFHK